MSGTYPDIAANNNKTFSRIPFFRVFINLNVRVGWIGLEVFYTSGKPILLGGWGGESRFVHNPG